jgi:uncharacterized protein YifN (PemK superfamily)
MRGWYFGKNDQNSSERVGDRDAKRQLRNMTQALQGVTDRRLRHGKPARGQRNAALRHDRVENAQQIQVHRLVIHNNDIE